jgi:hypothetical protein
VPGEKSGSPAKKRAAALSALIRQNLGVCQATRIVDCDVQKIPARAPGCRVPTAASHAMTGTDKAAELLGVDVYELAGPTPNVAVLGFHWIECAQSRQSRRRTDALNSRLRDTERNDDAILRKTQPSQ